MSKLGNAFGHMRDVVGGWAQQHHSDEFIDLMRAWLGPQSPTPDTVTQAVSFALMARSDGKPSLADRYAERGYRHSRAERVVLDGWRQGRFAVLEVLDVERDRGLTVRDVFEDSTLFLHEKAATHTLLHRGERIGGGQDVRRIHRLLEGFEGLR